jgi:hypothetical protein
MRLMNVLMVRLLVLRRTYVVSRFGPVRMVIVRMLRRSLVVIRMLLRGLAVIVVRGVSLRTTVVFVLMILGATVVIIIVPVLCVRGSACC